MALTTFTCPGCRATLRSGKTLTAGTKIKCPKCGHIFPLPEAEDALPEEEAVARAGSRAPRRAEPRADFAEYDDGEDDDDRYDEEEEVRPRKRKRKKAGNQTLILAASIGGLVLLLAGVGFAGFVWPGFFRGAGDNPLAYVPANSTMIMSVDVEAVVDQLELQSQLQDALKNSPGGGVTLSDCKKQTDLEFKELFNQVTVAMNSPLQGMGQIAAPGAGPKMVVVVKSKVPFDKEKVLTFLKIPDTTYKLGGKTVYKKKENAGEVVYHFPSKRLMVASNLPEKDLEAVFGSNGRRSALTGDAATLVDSVKQGNFWMAVPFDAAMKDNIRKSMSEGAAGGPGANPLANMPEVKSLQTALMGAKGLGLAVVLDSNQMKLNVSLGLADKDAAAKATGDIQKVWETVKAFITLGMLTQPKPVQTLGNEMIKSVKFTSQGEVLQASAEAGLQNVKNAAREGFKEAAKAGGAPAGASNAFNRPNNPGARPNTPPQNNPPRGGRRSTARGGARNP